MERETNGNGRRANVEVNARGCDCGSRGGRTGARECVQSGGTGGSATTNGVRDRREPEGTQGGGRMQGGWPVGRLAGSMNGMVWKG